MGRQVDWLGPKVDIHPALFYIHYRVMKLPIAGNIILYVRVFVTDHQCGKSDNDS